MPGNILCVSLWRMENPTCPKCNGQSIRNGMRQGRQRFRCKTCRTQFLNQYQYQAVRKETNKQIIVLVKEGCGIRSIARLLSISPTTVQRRILRIAAVIQKPPVVYGKDYEVDELCTFIGRKDRKRWVAYALRKDNRQVVDFRIGTRSKRTLKPLLDTLILAQTKRVYTDGLPYYRNLLDPIIHRVKRFGTNHIERMNLTLRTHLKRLNRRTICFSRSFAMLNACLKIYFWYDADRFL